MSGNRYYPLEEPPQLALKPLKLRFQAQNTTMLSGIPDWITWTSMHIMI